MIIYDTNDNKLYATKSLIDCCTGKAHDIYDSIYSTQHNHRYS